MPWTPLYDSSFGRFLVSQRATSIFLPYFFFFFHRFSSVLIAHFAFATLWEWEIFMKSGRASRMRELLGHSRSECEKVRGHPGFRVNGHWTILRMITLFGFCKEIESAYKSLTRILEQRSISECIFFLVNYFFIIKREIWIINFRENIMLLIEIKRKKFWNDW